MDHAWDIGLLCDVWEAFSFRVNLCMITFSKAFYETLSSLLLKVSTLYVSYHEALSRMVRLTNLLMEARFRLSST